MLCVMEPTRNPALSGLSAPNYQPNNRDPNNLGTTMQPSPSVSLIHRAAVDMPPLKITIRGVDVVVTAQPLTGNAFSPFGEVIQNPRPDVHPSKFADAGPLPLDAVSANQGSAIKYQHVTRMVNRYERAPSGKPGVAVMNMFVCAARAMETRPGRSAGGKSSTPSAARVFEVGILERHPFTTQTFTPLSTSGPRDPASKEGYLVVVAPKLERPSALLSGQSAGDTRAGTTSAPGIDYAGPDHDQPDPTQLKAFIATTDQAVTYGAGIWHAPMVALGPEGSTVDFVVTQFSNGVGAEDCEEVVFESPEKDGHLLVELPPSSGSGAARRLQINSKL